MNMLEYSIESNFPSGRAALETEPFALDQLRRRCMGREDLVNRFLASFERKFPLEIDALARCLDVEDDQQLVQLTHQLKGAAANISALRLQRLLGQMEAAARRGAREIVRELYAQLQGEWEIFTEYRGSVCSL